MKISYDDKHKFYSFINLIIKESNFKIHFIKTISSRISFNITWIDYFLFFIDSVYITYVIFRNYKNDYIILREFNTIPFIINAIILYPLRKGIILNINHNFQKASISKLHNLCIRFIDFLGYRFLCFESDKPPFYLKNKVISIPFPIDKFNYSEININNLTLGFVGSYRKEKNIEVLLKALEPLDKKFKLILGTDNLPLLDEYSKKRWNTFNTTNFDDYTKAIDSVDILVVNYEKDAYYYRHSGVITDFVQKGKVVIVPNYIYFNDQLTTPVEVGLLFNDINNIDNLIKNNLHHLLNNFDLKLEQYFKYRSFSHVVELLDKQLERN